MRKIISKITAVILLLSVITFSSCVSDLFSKNKSDEKANLEAPVVAPSDSTVVSPTPTTKETETPAGTATSNEPGDSIVKIPTAPIASDNTNKQKEDDIPEQETVEQDASDSNTIKFLIADKPTEIEEPLVRDLEINDTDTSEITDTEKAIDSKLQDTILTTENNSGKVGSTSEQSQKPSSITTGNTNNSANQTEAPVKPATISETKENTTSNIKASTSKSDTSAQTKQSSKTEDSINSGEIKVSESDKTSENSNETNLQNTEQQDSQKVVESTSTELPEDERSILSSSGTPDAVEIPQTKTTTAPVTSAGTKTTVPQQTIPAKPTNDNSKENSEKPKSTQTVTEKTTSSSDLPENDKSSITQNTNTQDITPSRSVTLNKGESLIVEYPGKGWIYLGSDKEYNNLESKGRKSGTDKTTYTLVAKEPGTQIQHFYKTDSLSGNYIDDYIEVTVRDIKGSASTEVKAPEYKEIVPEKPTKPAYASDKIAKPDVKIPSQAESQNQSSNKTKTGERSSFEYTPEDTDEEKAEQYSESYDDVKTSSSIDQTQDYDTADLLSQAQALYDEKKYADALKVINVFLDYAISNRDKGLYLKGQILEADSTVKNIKEAISCYNNIIDDYPTSELWDKANKRIIYLRRFYLEAR